MEKLNKAIQNLLEVVDKMDKETTNNIYERAPLIIHQRFCHELVSIAKRNEKQKMDEVPEFMNMLNAIEILEGLYPKLKKEIKNNT